MHPSMRETLLSASEAPLPGKYYLSLDQGDVYKVVAGQIGYQLLKMVGYKEQKKTDAKFDVSMQTLIDEIDEWRRQKFISEGEAREQKNALYAMQSQHVIKEVLFERKQFEMVYGLTGFIRLNAEYASVCAFTSFKLSSN
uniref:Uncharacterized protein n=1 Tax=Romanomermis culicivorax TaxID=13658 RepID=A0A915HR67_ROMCU